VRGYTRCRTWTTRQNAAFAGIKMEAPQASMSKKIVMITTEHSIQQDDYSPRGEFRNILLYLISTFSPKRIMEEWRSDGHSTIGQPCR